LLFDFSRNKKHLKNVGPIRHNKPPHANSPDVASGTVASMSTTMPTTTTTTTMTTTTRDRGDRYGPMEWAQSCIYLVQFSSYSELFVKSCQIQQTLPAFGTPIVDDPIPISPRSLATKYSSPWAIIWHCFHNLRFTILIQ